MKKKLITGIIHPPTDEKLCKVYKELAYLMTKMEMPKNAAEVLIDHRDNAPGNLTPQIF